MKCFGGSVWFKRKIHKTVVTPTTAWMHGTETSVSEENAGEQVG